MVKLSSLTLELHKRYQIIKRIRNRYIAYYRNISDYVGTLPYNSEQITSQRSIDHRTDIFALGVTLYEMLTKTSIQGIGDNEIMRAILKTYPPPPKTQSQCTTRHRHHYHESIRKKQTKPLQYMCSHGSRHALFPTK